MSGMRGPNLYVDGERIQVITNRSHSIASHPNTGHESSGRREYKPDYVIPAWYYRPSRHHKSKPKPPKPKKPKTSSRPKQTHHEGDMEEMSIPSIVLKYHLPEPIEDRENSPPPQPNSKPKPPKPKKPKPHRLHVVIPKNVLQVPEHTTSDRHSWNWKVDLSRYALSPSKSRELTNEIGVPVPVVKIRKSTPISEEEARAKFQLVAERHGGTIRNFTRKGGFWVATIGTREGVVTVKMPTTVVLDASTALRELKKQGYDVYSVRKKGEEYIGVGKGIPSTKIRFVTPAPVKSKTGRKSKGPLDVTISDLENGKQVSSNYGIPVLGRNKAVHSEKREVSPAMAAELTQLAGVSGGFTPVKGAYQYEEFHPIDELHMVSPTGTALNPGLEGKLKREQTWYDYSMQSERVRKGNFGANLVAGMWSYGPWRMAEKIPNKLISYLSHEQKLSVPNFNPGFQTAPPSTIPFSQSGNRIAYLIGAGIGIGGDLAVSEGIGAGAAIAGSRTAVAGDRALSILRKSQRVKKISEALSRGIRYATGPLKRIPGVKRTYRIFSKGAKAIVESASKATPYLKRAGGWMANTRGGQLTVMGAIEAPVDIKRYKEGMAPGDIVLHTARDFATGYGFMKGFEKSFPKTDLALNRMKVTVGRRYGRHYVPWQKIEHSDGTVEYVLTKHREGIQQLSDGVLRSVFASKYSEKNIPTPAGEVSIGRQETTNFAHIYTPEGRGLALPGRYRLAVTPKTSPVKNTWAFFGRSPLDDIATNFRIMPKPEIWQYRATPVSENIWEELSEINRYARMGRTPFSLRFKPASISESEFYTTVSEPIHTTTIRELSRSSVDSARPFYERLDKMAGEMSEFKVERPGEAYYRLLRSPYYKGASPVKAGFKVSHPSWTFEKNIPAPTTKLPKNIWAERRAYLMARKPFSLDYKPATGFWQERIVNSIVPGANEGKVGFLEIPERNTVLKTGTTPLKWAEENVAEFPKNFEIWTKYGPEGPGKPMVRETGAIRRFAAPDHQRGWSAEFRKGDLVFIKGDKLRTPGEQYEFFIKTGNHDFNSPYTVHDETTFLERMKSRFNDVLDYTKSKVRRLKNLKKGSSGSGVASGGEVAGKTEDFDEMNELLEKWNGKKPSKLRTSSGLEGKPNTSPNGLTTLQKTEQDVLNDIVQKGTSQDVGMRVLKNAYKTFPLEDITPRILLPPSAVASVVGGVSKNTHVHSPRPRTSTLQSTAAIAQPQTMLSIENEDLRKIHFIPVPIPTPFIKRVQEGGKGSIIPVHSPPSPRQTPHPRPPVVAPYNEPPRTGHDQVQAQTSTTIQTMPTYIPETSSELPLEVGGIPSPPPGTTPPGGGLPPLPFDLPGNGGSGGMMPGWMPGGEYGFWIGTSSFLGGGVPITSVQKNPEEQIYMEYVRWLVKQGFALKTAMRVAAEIMSSRKVTPAFIEQVLARPSAASLKRGLGRRRVSSTPKLKNMALLNEQGSQLF